jgi:hypothetical protein
LNVAGNRASDLNPEIAKTTYETLVKALSSERTNMTNCRWINRLQCFFFGHKLCQLAGIRMELLPDCARCSNPYAYTLFSKKKKIVRIKSNEADLMQLACWLSQIVTEQADRRHEAIALLPEQCKEHLMMTFPIVQGYALQQKLRELGEQPTDPEALRRALTILQAHYPRPHHCEVESDRP